MVLFLLFLGSEYLRLKVVTFDVALELSRLISVVTVPIRNAAVVNGLLVGDF